MHWSKKASLVCLSLCVEYAHATVSVTSSADSGPGTLREAIETIDAGTGTPPISLDPGVNPIVSSTMTVLTKDTAIIAGDAPTTHTIFGSGYHVLNAGTLEGTGSGVLVSVEKEILFSSASLLVSGGTIQIHGPLTGIVNIDIAGATPIMQFSTTGGVLAGTIQLLGDEESNIAVDPAISVEVTGTISGGRLTKIGAGRLFLPNANVYSGTVHSSGVIEVGHNQSLGVGPCIFHGAAILLIRTGLLIANEITFESSATIEVPGTASLTGLLKGNGSLTLVGGGYLSIEGGSSYVGSTSIASGTLAINKNGSIASSQGVWVAGTLDISGAYADVNINSLSGTESILLGSNTLIVSQLVTDLFSGVISGFGGLTLGQPGQNTLILSGVNTYTGATTINSGTLAISGLGSMASSSALTINTTGIFDISAATATVNVPTLSGDGNIFLGGEELSVNQTHAATLSGVISGTLGDFTLASASSSTLTLTGVNTYTGETNILGGVLALSGSGSIATSTLVNVVGTLDVQAATGPTIQTLLGSGQIILGPDLTINQGAPGTFSGQITGPSGGLILGSSSTAALTLSGSNTYLGATQIQGGTLAMAGSGSIALSQTVSVLGIFDISAATSPVTIQSLSGSGNILLGSQRLNVIQQFPLTFSGVISDTGGLTLSNLGKSDLVLSGVNTYTGTTEIFGGTLVLSGSGDISSSSAVIVDAVLNIAELSASSTTIQNLSGTSSGFLLLGTKNCVIEQPLDQTFSGMVLGTSGGLTKMGGGQLTLLGSNSFTGVITVGQGTLVGNTKSLPSSIVNNGSLIFQMTESGTYAKSISGVGALQKTGSAALTLTGINSYTGNTTVAEGTLTVNGSIPNSPIFVLPGARLKGIGTIKSVQVQGAVNPGTSSGTLYVAGDATFVTGSTYEVTLDSKGVSDLVATGTITIQSGVLCEIDPEDGFLSSFAAPHRILEGGSILGIFSAVTSTSPLVSGRLVYHPSFVDLFIELLPLTSLGLEGNSKQVAEAIDEVLASGNHALDGVAASLYPLSFSEINAALNQMQPALYKGFVASQENNLVNMQEMLHVRMQQELDFMRCDPLDKKKEPCSLQKKVVHVWTSGFGDNLHQSSTTYAQSPQVGYQDNTGGIVAGVDGRFATYCYLGAFGGYTSSSLTWDDTQGQGTIQSGYGGLYFSVLGRMFYANLAVLGGFGSCFGHRNISYPGVRETAYESYSGQQILSHIDTGVNWNIHGWTLRPFDSLDYIASTAAGFTESGAGAYDLIVSPSSAIMLRNELGLEFAYCFCVQGYKWNLAPSTSWIREIRVSGSTYTATFINTDVPFTVTGYLPSRNLFSPGCILSGAFWKDHLLLNFYYKGMFGSGYTEQSYGGQVQLRF